MLSLNAGATNDQGVRYTGITGLTSAAFLFACWLRPESVTTNSQRLFQCETAANGPGLACFLGDSGTGVLGLFRSDSGTPVLHVSTDRALVNANNYFVVFYHDGSGSARIWSGRVGTDSNVVEHTISVTGSYLGSLDTLASTVELGNRDESGGSLDRGLKAIYGDVFMATAAAGTAPPDATAVFNQWYNGGNGRPYSMVPISGWTTRMAPSFIGPSSGSKIYHDPVSDQAGTGLGGTTPSNSFSTFNNLPRAQVSTRNQLPITASLLFHYDAEFSPSVRTTADALRCIDLRDMSGSGRHNYQNTDANRPHRGSPDLGVSAADSHIAWGSWNGSNPDFFWSDSHSATISNGNWTLYGFIAKKSLGVQGRILALNGTNLNIYINPGGFARVECATAAFTATGSSKRVMSAFCPIAIVSTHPGGAAAADVKFYVLDSSNVETLSVTGTYTPASSNLFAFGPATTNSGAFMPWKSMLMYSASHTAAQVQQTFDYFRSRHNWTVPRKHVVITTGSSSMEDQYSDAGQGFQYWGQREFPDSHWYNYAIFGTTEQDLAVNVPKAGASGTFVDREDVTQSGTGGAVLRFMGESDVDASNTQIAFDLKTEGTKVTGVSLSRSGSTVTITEAAHTKAVGDCIKLSAFSDSTYNRLWTVATIAAGSYTFTQSSGSAGPITGDVSIVAKAANTLTGAGGATRTSIVATANISSSSFHTDTINTYVAGLVADTSLPPSYVFLEQNGANSIPSGWDDGLPGKAFANWVLGFTPRANSRFTRISMSMHPRTGVTSGAIILRNRDYVGNQFEGFADYTTNTVFDDFAGSSDWSNTTYYRTDSIHLNTRGYFTAFYTPSCVGVLRKYLGAPNGAILAKASGTRQRLTRAR